MALLVQCHQCGKVLELDDGFRGGVCRCSQCGALLRVPMTDTHDVQKSRPAEPAVPKSKPPTAAAGASAPASAAAHGERPESPDVPSSHRPVRPESPGALAGSGAMRPSRPESPLTERLAQRPATPSVRTSDSSGGSQRVQPPIESRDRSRKSADSSTHPASHWESTAPRKLANLPIWVYAVLMALLLMIVVALIVGVVLMMSRPGAALRTPSRTAAPHAENTAAENIRFLGIPVKAGTVVFSFDGSSANGDSFNLLVAALNKIAGHVPNGVHIKIAVWTPTGLKIYPARGFLTPQNSKAIFHSLLMYSPYGSTSMTKMMVQTLKLGCHQNIFTTQKIIAPTGLSAAVKSVLRPGRQVDVISINGEEHTLKKLAQSTGGRFEMLSPSDLQSAQGR